MLKLYVEAKPRYWEDATVNGIDDENGDLIPCSNGFIWSPVIDIEKGIIENWQIGTEAKVHYKICDDGCYYIRDANGRVVMSIENDYVPKCLCPKENGYGDYIIMNIDANGFIEGWKSDQALVGFEQD